jgi:hypothetical protein
MIRPWRFTLRVTRLETRLLVTRPEGDLLKARLDTQPCHPRALLTLLEGISLWSGEPLRVALSADDDFRDSCGSRLFGDELWPAESQLVRFEPVHLDRPERRLEGLGDFHAVRRVQLRAR